MLVKHVCRVRGCRLAKTWDANGRGKNCTRVEMREVTRIVRAVADLGKFYIREYIVLCSERHNIVDSRT